MTAEQQPRKPFERQRLEEVVPHEKLTQLSHTLAGLEQTSAPDHPILHEVLMVGKRIIATYDRLQANRRSAPNAHDPTRVPGQSRRSMHTHVTSKDTGLNFNYAFAWCMETAARVSQTLGEQDLKEDVLHTAATSLRTYAKERFITSNLPLVHFYAQAHIRALGEEHVGDLLSVGARGLERAVELYDYRRGFTFSTFAKWHIREQMQKYRIRTERHARRTHTFTSLTRHEEDAQPYEDSLPAHASYEPEEVVVERAQHSWLQSRMGSLDARARSMLADRFGIGTDTGGASINALAKKYRLSEAEVERHLTEMVDHLKCGEGIYQVGHPLHTQGVLDELADASYEDVAAFWLNRYLRLRPQTVSRLLQQDWKPLTARFAAIMARAGTEAGDTVTQHVFETTILDYLAAKKDKTPAPPKQVIRMTRWIGVDLEDPTIRTSFHLIGVRVHVPPDTATRLVEQGIFVWAHELQAELDLSRDALRKRIGDGRFYTTSPHHTWEKLIPIEMANTLRGEQNTVSQRSLYSHVGARYPRQWLEQRGAGQFDKTAAQEMLEEHRLHREDLAQKHSARDVTRLLGISQTTLTRWTRELAIATTKTPLDAHLVLYTEEDVLRLSQHAGSPPEDTELSLGEILQSVGYTITRSALLKQIQKLVSERGVPTPVRKGRLGGVKSPHYPEWFVSELNKKYADG